MTGIKLEAGKTYIARNGDKYGPLVHHPESVGTIWEYSLGDGNFAYAWRADGRVYKCSVGLRDLIEEVVEAKITMRNSPNWNDGTIHGWNGGNCPVHPETELELWTRGGSNLNTYARNIKWDHFLERERDVIAFRVVKEYVGPKVIWVNEYAEGCHLAFNTENEAKKGAGEHATRIAVKYVEAIADVKECKE